jgi:fructose-specific phosphotransferase system component IIB
MTPEEQKLKEAIARRGAEMIINTLDASGVPHDIQLEAVMSAAGALFFRNVKAQHVVGLFNASVSKVRDNIKAAIAKQREITNNARH